MCHLRLLFLLPLLLLQQQHTLFALATPSILNVTALSASAGSSTIECWQLVRAAFTISGQAGTSGTAIAPLGNVANVTFTVLPAKFDGGTHNAPYVQWVAFLSGKAVLSLPDSRQTATVYGGKHGLILAADTADVSKMGHITKYPSNTETIALQIPIEGGVVPRHKVLHAGACTAGEVGF